MDHSDHDDSLVHHPIYDAVVLKDELSIGLVPDLRNDSAPAWVIPETVSRREDALNEVRCELWRLSRDEFSDLIEIFECFGMPAQVSHLANR